MGFKTGSHFAIHENYRAFSYDRKNNFLKKFYNLQTVTILSKAHKNACISSKKSHFESENLPYPFSLTHAYAPEFFGGWDKKYPRYHNFKKKEHF